MKKNILFKKIYFSNGSFNEILRKIDKGGLLVAPAASALVEIENDKEYYRSLVGSDVALLDSGFFCILLRIFKRIKVKKLSGYKFLKEFVNLKKNKNQVILLIDPSKEDSIYNLEYLKLKEFKKIHSYIAPLYKDNKSFNNDKNLLKKISKFKPKFIIINIGGGKQEPLGFYIKKKVSKKISIICTGAAIAFLTGKQAPINDVVDKLYLGWAMRLIYNPINTYKRFFNSFKLIKFFI